MPKHRSAIHQTHQHHHTPSTPESDPDDNDSEPAAPTTTAKRSKKTAATVGGSKRERTKEGCLTCRMRRKKCEIERQSDGSCLTCHRLRIECYGFGAKRPDWMKDKAVVESKLHEIKEHLVAAGLVRGVAKDKSQRKGPQARSSAPAHTANTTDDQDHEEEELSPTTTYTNIQPASTNPTYPSVPRRPVSPIISHSHALPYTHPVEDPLVNGYGQNPRYLVSRAASRSPVMLPSLPTSSSATVPANGNGEEVEEIGGTGDLSGGGYVNDFGMGMLGMASSSSSMGSGLPHPLALSLTDPLIGPIMPMPYYSDPTTTDSYYQEMQQAYTLLISRGVPASIAPALISASFQSQLSSLSPSFPTSTAPITLYPWLHSSLPQGLAPALPPYMTPQKDGFMYYFEHVASMQYIFDPHSTSTMHTYIRLQPSGVVATAIKMLSSMHDAQSRVASGLPTTGALRTRGTPEELYSDTYRQIMAVLKRSGGRLGEEEATAALHMISYWLFQGGDGKWGEALKIAVHWFQNYGDLYSRNGPQVIRSMSAEQRFAAKTTMWMDIFSAITQCRAPYLNGMYTYLLTSSLASDSQQASTTYPPLHRSPADSFFGTTNGCCDAVMCSLAAIVTLEADMAAAGAMSALMDLESARIERAMFGNRARQIRDGLEGLVLGHDGKIVEVKEELVGGSIGEEYFNMGADDDESILEAGAGTGPTPTSTPCGKTNGATAGVEYETSDIFRHAALIYLSTVMNGPSPLIASTAASVHATYSAIIALPSSAVDRSLVFPLCIAGCSTDNAPLRAFFEERLSAMSGPVGNGAKTLELMRMVWNRRDQYGEVVGWRDVMRDSKMEILLV